MSNVPGLFVAGEANFSDHGANRLGASALMQGLADGYFVVPYTLANYLASTALPAITAEHAAFGEAAAATQARIDRLFGIRGGKTVLQLHRALGKVMWDQVGMARTEAGLADAVSKVRALRDEFWHELRIPGDPSNVNKELELALRLADYMEFAELLAIDAQQRRESCGCHFREEHQTEDGEAKRNDAEYSYVAAWEFRGVGEPPVLHKEPLTFENVSLSQRSYK
jgi:succinate dehydrogenase / fumarate reductase flavoprotein subunit